MMSISSTQANEYRGNAMMSTMIYSPDESVVRKRERPEPSFMDSIVGRRGGLRAILAQVEAVAPTNATILISGETGTGKEVIARAIHDPSPPPTRNLFKANCPPTPPRLLETHL